MELPLPIKEDASVTAGPAESAWLRTAKVATLLAGVVIVCSGLLAGFAYLLVSLLASTRMGSSTVALITMAFSILALSLVVGGSLIFQAVGALTRRPSSVIRTPSPILFLLAFLAVILWGTLLSLSSSQMKLLSPVPYVLGIALPVIWVLAVVGNRLVRRGVFVTWRETVLQLSSGAFVAIALALLLEMLALIAMILVALLIVAVMPGGAATLRHWAAVLQTPGWADNSNNLRNVILHPSVVLGIYLTVALVIPLIEELLKTLGVVLMSYRHPSPAQALWWGILGGAGFALTEGLLNTNLAAGDVSWVTIVPLRFGTTILHCCTGGLMGLGWYALITYRRWQDWGKSYIQAVGLHALWNAVAVSLAFASVSLSPQAPDALPLTPLSAVLTAFLVLQAAVMLFIILRLVARQTAQIERPA